MAAFFMIFRRFQTTFRRFPKIFQNCSEVQTNAPENFPKIPENAQRLPKTFEEDPKMFRGIEWFLRAFASMRAVRLFLRARAVINFLVRGGSTLEITNGEQRALRKFSAS